MQDVIDRGYVQSARGNVHREEYAVRRRLEPSEPWSASKANR